MSDALFADYQKLGVALRSDLIITKEYRDSHPLQFNTDAGNAEGWVTLHH